ncbi:MULTISPECIES: hypothetical protein [Gordonia]|uniref:Uncharacterized protein n=2 Tax=Gordonia terrae TaxID=2055 RepID=A0A2I1R5P5_9ACTN|nr:MULTISPECIES: hypothetical protein [Gordonia]ANY21907.1 hypothetical protein BCM27_02995 [Gordonia terrae]AWO82644.1 hypothetical protein DLJ61_03015 [Gordonia terrae]MCG7633056.1 hypothetical protein [Gordonia sp. McavH-238-E]PKZ64460.1 hypothetical protein CYJ73_16405 [Gordonia terrae]UPW09803.1 hypothetical protein M1C59_02805 [Gordonia terrae]
MHDEASDRGTHTYRQVTRPSRAFFLLARPTQNTDQLPSSIGERDVFFSEEEALDALDLHYAWCAARSGGFTDVVTTAQWYLQTAMVGPRVTASLGEVYLASSDAQSGEIWAAAGGFLTEGELIHWSSFVRAARSWIPLNTGTDGFELAYRGDTEVHFHQLWFAPMQSIRVYPKQIAVDSDGLG